ncbi:MAG: acyl-ACP thioesterase domain-containing protein [Bacteroidota bacterium]
MKIDYKGQAVLGDELEMTTWIDKAEGVRTRRNTEIRDGNSEKIIVSAKTMWCLIDGHSKRPKRFTAEFI